jgi:hypothetical protein
MRRALFLSRDYAGGGEVSGGLLTELSWENLLVAAEGTMPVGKAIDSLFSTSK